MGIDEVKALVKVEGTVDFNFNPCEFGKFRLR
jgi:hypothetical protein